MQRWRLFTEVFRYFRCTHRRYPALQVHCLTFRRFESSSLSIFGLLVFDQGYVPVSDLFTVACDTDVPRPSFTPLIKSQNPTNISARPIGNQPSSRRSEERRVGKKGR